MGCLKITTTTDCLDLKYFQNPFSIFNSDLQLHFLTVRMCVSGTRVPRGTRFATKKNSKSVGMSYSREYPRVMPEITVLFIFRNRGVPDFEGCDSRHPFFPNLFFFLG